MTQKEVAQKELTDRLQNYLAGRFSNALISGFQFMASGWESELYAFDLQDGGEEPKELILRLFPGEGALQKLTREAHGLQLLHKAGFPVPEMFLYEPNPIHLGKPFSIIERLFGQSLWPILAQSDPGQAKRMLERFGRFQAHLHRLDWRPFTEKAALYEAKPAMILAELCDALRKEYLQFDVKGFLALADWLESHQAEIKVAPAVVHLDFHANNAFLCQDDRLAVIDWTQICVSDYRLDLTWTLMIMSDYGKVDWGEQILEAYCQAAEHPVEQLDYFFAITYAKLLTSTIIALKSGPGRLGMRSEMLKLMKAQAANLARLADRLQELTDLRFPEVEAALRQLAVE